jgi:hypothetical protein
VVAARATVGGPGRRQGRLIALADYGGVEGLAGQDAAEEQQGADLDAGGLGARPGVISTVAGSNGTLVSTEPGRIRRGDRPACDGRPLEPVSGQRPLAAESTC